MPLSLQIEDWVRGSHKNAFYHSYGPWTGMTPTQVRAKQLEKLQKLLHHAYEHIPWYKNVFREAGISPRDIRSQVDLQQLPALSRDDIRDRVADMTLPNFGGKVLKSSSSGTTGIPITYYQDMKAMSAGSSAGFHLLRMGGYRFGMSNVHVWGNMASIQHWSSLSSQLKQRVYRRKNIAATLLNDPANIPDVVKQIQDFKPDMIDGYANSLYVIAQYLQTHNLRIPSIKVAFTTAENLEPHQQELIGKALGPVSDLYGCSEINGIGVRPPGEKHYYIFEPHVVVETQALPGQDMQEILVTDLDNYYMPMIRYKIGDLIDVVHPGEEGNAFPFSYFNKVFGRSSDHVVLPNGVKLFPVNIFGGTLYRKYPQITRHRVTWNEQYLRFEFEVNQPFPKEALEADIKTSLAEYRVDYRVEYTPHLLPGKSGKYNYFVKESAKH
ncbi:MAG: phenylacetate--CoA ligase family protein [Saprospirales bacterium]|nr:phenylacetate--CoA ligase family protein [Saprospirales bacterium]